MTSLPKDINKLIEKSFATNINSFKVTVHDGNKKGEGFLGEIVFVTLKNRKSDRDDHLVIKRVFSSDKAATRDFLSSSFSNEIHFYTKIWPEMKKFQETFPESTRFDVAPKCYGTSSEKGEEIVILENLRNKNYEMHPKKVPLSDELYEKIFKWCANFHALSFALKHYRPETFHKLTTPLKNNWLKFMDLDLCHMLTEQTFESIRKILVDAKQEDILNKLQPFMENWFEISAKGTHYNGPYSVIVHGDCWSNNVMFKYNDFKQLEDIKLLDYQMCTTASPVYDLKYTFYSGASKESLEDWERFLKFYHNSLCETLKEYNLDGNKIYPYVELKKEWKNYKFPVFESLLIWGVKFTDEEDIRDLDVTEEPNENSYCRNKDYIYQMLNLLKHIYENNLL